MRYARTFTAAALALSLTVAGTPVAAFAEPANSVEDARAAMQAYGEELAAFENDLANAGEVLEQTKAEINDTQEQIDQTKADYDKACQDLSQRMRADYRGGAFSILDIILGATSIEDFVSRIYYLTRMNEMDLQMLEQTEQLQDELVSHMADLEETKAHCEQTLANVEATQQELTDKLEEAQAYFNMLSPEVQGQLTNEVVSQIESNSYETNDMGVVTDGLVSAVTNVQVANYQQGTTEAATASESSQSVVNAITSNTGSYSSGLSGAVDRAYGVIGTRYTWGGTTVDTGFDCSGLVNYAYGSDRGRTTYDMIDSLKSSGDWKTSVDDLEYGDLVFPSEGHVAIYIGDGQIIHAPKPGESVTVSTLYDFYGGGTY